MLSRILSSAHAFGLPTKRVFSTTLSPIYGAHLGDSLAPPVPDRMADVRVEGRVAPMVTGPARPLPEELRIDVRDVDEAAWGLALCWLGGR